MKRLFLLLLLSITFACPYVFAEDEELPPPPPPSDDPTTPPAVLIPPVIIPINPPGGDNGNNHRSLSPISGMYIDGVVELYFIEDMGSVSVTVISDMGDSWYIDGDSQDNLLIIPITPQTGAYTITISTQSAGLFTGKFNL